MTATPSAHAVHPLSPGRFAVLGPVVLIGLPLAIGLIAVVHLTPLHDTIVGRYLSHPVEYAEVILFSAAVALLTVKLYSAIAERIRCGRSPLPAWDGRPLPTSEASRLLASVRGRSSLARRASSALSFLTRRGSAVEFDDHLRDLADADANNQESSYGLIKFITWAIPILGFLGTVVGITEAIAGVNPEVLEKNLNAVTDGLATAFDTTALALLLTMLVMFFSFSVDKLEQSVLRAVDDWAAEQLAHRFERVSSEGAPVFDTLRQQSRVLIEAVEQLVKRQTELWAESLRHEPLADALEQALSRSLQSHADRAAELQEHAAVTVARLVEQLNEFQQKLSASLGDVTADVCHQARLVAGVQASEQHLIRQQQNLDRNLHLLANAETLQQAVHSLTAAVHLLTSRTTLPMPDRLPGRAA